MASAIVLLAVAAACAFCAWFSLRAKGPLLTVAYLTTRPEGRKAMRTRRAYRQVGTAYIIVGAASAFAAAYAARGSQWLLAMAALLAGLTLLYSILQILSCEKRGD